VAVDNVDTRLLARFEASVAHERARRELLPPMWISTDADAGNGLGDLYDVVLERARERVRTQRREYAKRARPDVDDPIV
jgi:hypothetical protein